MTEYSMIRLKKKRPRSRKDMRVRETWLRLLEGSR
ncbi:hypothetical protein HRED_10057 [Candidatus Haloredivivus sp. G17]|nr:hypothetical protein HRED_10057 [Candidatus Haloredivivus sp. G17]